MQSEVDEKKLVSVITIIAIVVSQITTVSVEANNQKEKLYTKKVNNYVKIISNFSCDEEGKYSEKVLKKEAKYSTGVIDEEIEVALNESGVLDEEIERWSDEDIRNIESASVINVQNSFSDTNDDCIDGEDYFKEYYETEYGKSTEKDSVIKKVLKGVGIIPVEAYAVGEGETKKFKQSIVTCNALCNDNNQARMYYIYTGIWKETPVYNGLDYVKIWFGNGYPESHSYAESYNMTYYPTSSNGVAEYTAQCSSTYGYKQYYDIYGQTSAMVYSFDLPGDKYGSEYLSEGRYDYSNFVVKISGMALLWDERIEKMSASSEYMHFKSQTKIGVTGISISANGQPSISLSISKYNQYTSMGVLSVMSTIVRKYK